MEYLNLHTSVLDSEAFQDAEPQDRSTWLLLLRYCAGQENGGLISGIKGWGEIKCVKLLGVSKGDAERGCPLWRWEGENLRVEFYPVPQENMARALREAGRRGGRLRGRQLKAEAKARREAPLEGELERKERKGKEREGNGARSPEEFAEFADIPSVEEVRDWAMGAAGVDPDYAQDRACRWQETHGWVKNGRLIDWRSALKRFWDQDREAWLRKKRAAAPAVVNGELSLEAGEVLQRLGYLREKTIKTPAIEAEILMLEKMANKTASQTL